MLKNKLVSQSTRVGPERSDRELGYIFKFYNDGIDIKRGKREDDFMAGRTWSERRAKELWTNIHGPSPGGYQHMASEVAMDGDPVEVTDTPISLQPPLSTPTIQRKPSMLYYCACWCVASVG